MTNTMLAFPNRIALLLFFIMLPLPVAGQKAESYGAVNSPADDFAASFRETCAGVECWLTSARGQTSPRSRSMLRSAGGGALEALPAPVNQPAAPGSFNLDGCPTFAACAGWGVFVSNRLVDGKNYDNDLYEIRQTAGDWAVARIDAVNSAAWDDTPALSPDGKYLYFSSDRRHPGGRLTDLYVSVRTSGGWSAPVALDGINTAENSEQTPAVGRDGYLYYATNQTRWGDYDIWRVKIDPANGLPAGASAPVEWEGVNRESSDEGHPAFSAGGRWFVFSSNRPADDKASGVKDFDLYRLKFGITEDTVTLNVLLHTREFNRDVQEFEDATRPLKTTIHLALNAAEKRDIATDARGAAELRLPGIPSAEPTDDRRLRTIIAHADPPSGKFISATDTLLFESGCNAKLSHSLTIWDTAVYYDPRCRLDFPITNVQFFVSAYWCPTTKNYSQYTPCKSVFPDSLCRTMPADPPCDDNDLYTYNIIPATVVASRRAGLCADLGEAARYRDEYSRAVDSAITKFIENMSAAFRAPCVRRAINRGLPVTVEVVGWTDPDPIDRRCTYTGGTINFASSFAQLENPADKPYIKANQIISGEKFRHEKWPADAEGNQLLSDLRAYYTATLLDALWTERIPEYRELKIRGNALRLLALGRAVSQEKTVKARQRSVNVRVSAEVDEEVRRPGLVAKPGRKVVLCGVDCGE